MTQAQTVALAQLTGFGLGSQIVGRTHLAHHTLATVCQICPRCQGEGFAQAQLIAGKWTGGDTRYLCHRCRGAGATTYALFPDQAEQAATRLLKNPHI